ncbi:O-antigen ligase family protein [Candidatus Falkowbacteria bacterium]|nr:O-antigen ligase family protein [Candidatus Falkowbacteria bacterium]
MKKIIECLLCLFVFLLPFQTRWIFQQGFLNGEKWEYGTFSLYATEILLGLIIVLAIVYAINTVRSLGRFGMTGLRHGQVATCPYILVLLVLLVLLNCVLALDKGIAFYKFSQLILGVALFFIILTIKPAFQKVAFSFALSGLVQSALAIQQFVEQKVIANKWLGMASQDPHVLGVPVVQFGDDRWLRTFGSFSHPNMLAGFLVISLIFTIGLFFLNQRRENGKLFLAIMAINFLALLTALSRASFVAIAAAVILLAIFVRRDRELIKKISKVALILIFIVTIFSVSYPELIASRAFGASHVENLSNVSRIEQYGQWWQIVKNNWFTGVGLGNYTLALSKPNPNLPAWSYQPIHNLYLLFVAELGLFGLALCLLFVARCLLLFIKRIKSATPSQSICFTCLACLACLACLDHYFWSFFSGIMLASVVLSQSLIEQ